MHIFFFQVQSFVNILLHRGAKPVAFDESGQTALHHAVRRNIPHVCQRLLENNAVANMRNRDRQTPYHIALQHLNDEIASMLLVYIPNCT